MATAAVDSSASDHHLNYLHSESIPLIDLHLFSQSELFSLSLCSASSSLHHHQNDPDVSTLKIDRSVFNESAGGRKQTFSRLRLAPRSNSQFSPSSSINASIPHQTAEQTLDEDSPHIVSLLKSMFGGNPLEVSNIEDNLVSVPIQYNAFLDRNDASQNNAAIGPSDYNGDGEMEQIAVEDSTAKKRKRGRPRKDASNSISLCINHNLNQDIDRTALDEYVKVEKEEEPVRINANAMLEEFGNMEDPYARELNRRTLDMQTREQLLEFLQGLDGEWLSSRKKRKIVGASALGDFLPRGWKLMLCMKKRAGYFWVDCRRYISPNGQQFMSCKEASSYLNSSLGLQDASQLNLGPVDGNTQMTDKKSSGNAADLTLIVDKNESALVWCPGLPLSKSVEHEKESMKVGIPGLAETVRKYKCHKCTMVFDEPDDLLQHLLSSHQRVPKRVRQETLNEEVIVNNGRYECQLCDKSFDERHRYYGHLGNHIKDYFKRIHASGEATRIRSTVPPLVAVHPSTMKIQESTEIDIGSVAINSNIQSNDEISYDVPDCKIKENATDESYCRKQGVVCSMIDDKPGDSNDIIAVENDSVQEGSPKCSLAAVGMEQICAPDNNANQQVNLIEGHAQELGFDSNLVAPSSTENGETLEDRLLSSAINSTEIHDRDFVGANKARTAFGNKCSSQEEISAPSGNDQKYASVNDVHGLSASTTVDMPSERISQVGLSSALDEKVGISNDKVNRVSTSTMKESRYDDMGGSSNNTLTVGFGCNNVTVEDFVIGNELESSSRSCLVNPTWTDQISYAENEMNGTYRCTITKHGEEKKSEGGQLTIFGSEQCLGSENTITKAPNDTREVPTHDEVLYVQNSTLNKGVDLIASAVTVVELQSSSGNSLLVPSGNELTFSLGENEVLNGAPKNLVQGKNSDSNSHKPSYDDQILNYENNVKVASFATVDQPKHKEVKSFFKGDTHIPFDCSHMEWDAGAVKSTIQESYSNDCSLVTSGSQWSATKDNVTGRFCSPLDEQKQASAKGLLNLSNSVEDWSGGNNSDSRFRGGVKEKLQVVKPRKNDGVTGFRSNIQASENAMSDFMWKHDEESDLLGSFADTSSRVAHSSGCFTTYDLMSDKGGNELFGEKFSGISGFEGLRSSNMENMEYDFMSNHSEESKVFSDDTEIAQGLGSSAWLEKEALPLLPKIASRRHVPALCVWCKTEFHYEDFESEMQTGSLNLTCAPCKAKFSSNFNLQ